MVTSCAPAVTEEEEVAPPEEEVVKEKVPPTFERPFRVGETAQSAKLAVTITEMYLTDSYEYYDETTKEMGIKEASPGKTFLFAYVKIKYVASTGSSIEGAVNMLGGYAESSVAFSYDWGEQRLPSKTSLSQGGKTAIEGKVLFVIPKESTGHWVKYDFWGIAPRVYAQWLAE